MLDNLLVCIGAQKAGTSWLHNILSKDERFAQVSNQFEIVKEVHYFDHLYDNHAEHVNDWRAYYLIDLIENEGQSLHKPLTAYLQHENEKQILLKTDDQALDTVKQFLALTNPIDDKWYTQLLKCHDKQQFSLDITPDYSIIGVEGFRHLKRVASNLKIVIILRNPIERAWSARLQKAKGEPGGIEGFFAQEDHDLDILYKQCTIGYDIGARTNYIKMLEDIYAAGLENNLKILFYDDIAEKPEDFIDSVYDFIELENAILKDDAYLEALSKKVYATEGKRDMSMLLEARLKIYYKRMLEDMIDIYKIDFPQTWLKYFGITR